MDIQYNIKKFKLSEKENDYLLFFDIQTEKYKALSDVISVDLRGNYGMVLSGISKVRDKKNELEKYYWKGNLFNITVEVNQTIIENLFNEEFKIYFLTDEFTDILEQWKNEYLKEMGFLKFEKSKTLSHIYAILLLAYYMRGDANIEDSYNDSIKYAINSCAHRYGISKSTLYSQCTRDIEIEGIKQFYKLSDRYLKNRDNDLMKYLENKFNIENIRDEFSTLFE